MTPTFRIIEPLHRCGYLPSQAQRLEYVEVAEIRPDEYMARMLRGWRRFGRSLFRPRCPSCDACRPLRVVVDRFRPDRSQRRARAANEATTELRIGPPTVDRARLDLYRRYHDHQAGAKGWPSRRGENAAAYIESFVDNPFPTQEWCYFVDGRLAGVGYVDDLPGGLSAIYFYYDPDRRDRSIGTWNVLSLIDRAATMGLPHVYLGYYVAGCPSLSYKARFAPNQVLGAGGIWHDFRP